MKGVKRIYDGLEARRHIFHILLGVALIILIKKGILNAWKLFLILSVGFVVSVLSRRFKIPIVWNMLITFERPEQLKKGLPGKGAIAYFGGVLLAFKLFPLEVALASIAILALGDPVSHFVGLMFGRIRNPLSLKKMLEGNIAGAIAGGLLASIFVSWKYAFPAALAALLIESVEIKMNDRVVDDNVVIPLAAGATILILRTLF
ncbi:MAG: hypothetical protein QXW00_00680 [Candidatus Woesearchaeota archaeon]